MEGGAEIVKYPSESLGAKNLLSKKKDTYMTLPCSSNDKTFIIRLSEDILLESISLKNDEFYSKEFQKFSLYGAINYPTSHWSYLGTFQYNKSNQMQGFEIAQKWVRYVKIDFEDPINHKGVCTLTQIQMFGTPVLVDFQNNIESNSVQFIL